MKSAQQILKEHGIDIMSLNDDFNTQLLHAMERYAEARIEQHWLASGNCKHKSTKYVGKLLMCDDCGQTFKTS